MRRSIVLSSFFFHEGNDEERERGLLFLPSHTVRFEYGLCCPPPFFFRRLSSRRALVVKTIPYPSAKRGGYSTDMSSARRNTRH